MHDLHVKSYRRGSFLARDFFQSFEFVIRMRSATDNRNVCRAAYIGQSAGNVCRIVVIATWNQDPDSGVPGVIGITIGGDVLPAPARIVNKRNCFVCATPNGHGTKLDVRNLNRQMTFPADADSLGESFESLVCFIANVADVNSAVACSDAG